MGIIFWKDLAGNFENAGDSTYTLASHEDRCRYEDGGDDEESRDPDQKAEILVRARGASLLLSSRDSDGFRGDRGVGCLFVGAERSSGRIRPGDLVAGLSGIDVGPQAR